MIRRAIVLFALVTSPLALHGQEQAPKQVPKQAPKQVLWTQPISALLGMYSVEYERVLGEETSLGFALNYWDPPFGDSGEELRYFSPEAKLRFYPGAEVLRKFSFGTTVGWTFVKDRQLDPLDFSSSEGKASGLKIGIDLDYSWLLGKRENFGVSLGVGARRVFLDDSFDGEDALVAYPTLRIAVGYAF